MNSNTFRKELECILTEAETRTYSGELARLTQSQAELEDRKKEVTADYKAKIDACISQSRVIARKVSTGKEMRDVECKWDFDYLHNVKHLIRLDTFAVEDSKAITEDERQRHFDFEKKKKAEESNLPDGVATPDEEMKTIEELATSDEAWPDPPGASSGNCVIDIDEIPCTNCGKCASELEGNDHAE